MAYYRPVLVSERERAHLWPDGRYDDAKWEDCGPTSIIMAVDGHTGGAKPASHTLVEAEGLRAAAGYGPSFGTNIQRLAATAVLRYKVNLPLYRYGFTDIWRVLQPGTCAAVAGHMGAFGPDSALSRWAPNCDSPHVVYVARETTLDKVVWIDPLAPAGAYRGDAVSKEQLRAFLSKGIASAVVWHLAKVA